MKGVIYARYSSDNQREESIEGQLFVKIKEYIIVINAEQHCKAIAIFVTNVERG